MQVLISVDGKACDKLDPLSSAASLFSRFLSPTGRTATLEFSRGNIPNQTVRKVVISRTAGPLHQGGSPSTKDNWLSPQIPSSIQVMSPPPWVHKRQMNRCRVL